MGIINISVKVAIDCRFNLVGCIIDVCDIVVFVYYIVRVVVGGEYVRLNVVYVWQEYFVMDCFYGFIGVNKNFDSVIFIKVVEIFFQIVVLKGFIGWCKY